MDRNSLYAEYEKSIDIFKHSFNQSLVSWHVGRILGSALHKSDMASLLRHLIIRLTENNHLEFIPGVQKELDVLLADAPYRPQL